MSVLVIHYFYFQKWKFRTLVEIPLEKRSYLSFSIQNAHPCDVNALDEASRAVASGATGGTVKIWSLLSMIRFRTFHQLRISTVLTFTEQRINVWQNSRSQDIIMKNQIIKEYLNTNGLNLIGKVQVESCKYNSSTQTLEIMNCFV